MSDYATYTDDALYAELRGRETTLGLSGMAARLNDRAIAQIRLELDSRNLPINQTRAARTGTYYVLSYCEPPFNVGVLHIDPRCSLIDEHASTRDRPAEVRVATPEEVKRQPGCKVCGAQP